MATIESLEWLLAEALQCMNDSAGLVRDISQLDKEQNLHRLGHAIVNVWEIREQIHKIRPDLKPPFVVEYEQNRERYERLSEIAEHAYALEESGSLNEARALYDNLCDSAVTGYFRMLGEAGLYRVSQKGQ